MGSFLGTSVSKKLVMALVGLFLITFLVVHLGINLLLVFSDTDESFNIVANFMGTNPVIKVAEIILFLGFFVHIVWGIILQIQNWMARPVGYKHYNLSYTTPFAKYMIHTAAIILIFLVLHIADFYVKAKFLGGAEEISYDGNVTFVHNLAALVYAKFHITRYVIGYIIVFIILGFHLWHGFQSAFQTFGINKKSYFPFIKAVGVIYTVVIVAGFTAIPLIIYFR